MLPDFCTKFSGFVENTQIVEVFLQRALLLPSSPNERQDGKLASLYSPLLPSALLCSPLLSSAPLCSPLLPSAPLCSLLLPSAPLCSPLLPSTPLCSHLLPSALLCSPLLPSTPLYSPLPPLQRAWSSLSFEPERGPEMLWTDFWWLLNIIMTPLGIPRFPYTKGPMRSLSRLACDKYWFPIPWHSKTITRRSVNDCLCFFQC